MGSQCPVLNGKGRDFQKCGLEEGDTSPAPPNPPKPYTVFISHAQNEPQDKMLVLEKSGLRFETGGIFAFKGLGKISK